MSSLTMLGAYSTYGPLTLSLADHQRAGGVVRDNGGPAHLQLHLSRDLVGDGDEHLAHVEARIRLLDVLHLKRDNNTFINTTTYILNTKCVHVANERHYSVSGASETMVSSIMECSEAEGEGREIKKRKVGEYPAIQI